MSQEIEKLLFNDLAQIIEQGKGQITKQVNSTIILVYWQVGYKINTHILENKRAAYAKEIVSTLSIQLKNEYGKSFELHNLRRMMQFAEQFTDFSIVVPLARQLTWSHFLKILPLKKEEAKIYYAQKAIEETWSKRELQNQIERKSFERQEIF
jgi:DUF1016 N-terminal domain